MVQSRVPGSEVKSRVHGFKVHEGLLRSVVRVVSPEITVRLGVPGSNVRSRESGSEILVCCLGSKSGRGHLGPRPGQGCLFHDLTGYTSIRGLGSRVTTSVIRSYELLKSVVHM